MTLLRRERVSDIAIKNHKVTTLQTLWGKDSLEEVLNILIVVDIGSHNPRDRLLVVVKRLEGQSCTLCILGLGNNLCILRVF